MNEFKLDSLKKENKDVSVSGDSFESGFEKIFNAFGDGNKKTADQVKAAPDPIPTQNTNPVHAPEPEKTVILESDLIASQKKGYEEGYAKGYAAAKSASEELEKQTLETVKNIDLKINELLQARKFEDLKRSEDVIDLALKVARKVSDKCLSENACQMVESVIIKSFEVLFDEPHILICVNSKILDEIKKRVESLVKSEGFSSEVEVVANDKINVGACQIQWQGGGLITDHEAVWKDIEAII